MNLFNKSKALNYILKVSTAKNISQAKLVDGIYDYSHFNRMCNGKEPINVELILSCAKKLDIDVEYLINISKENSTTNLTVLKEEFLLLSLNQDYKKIIKFNEILQPLSNSDIQFKQFQIRVNAMIIGQIEKNYDKSIAVLNKALSLTINYKHLIDIDYSLISNEEILIINNIAICYNALSNNKCIIIIERLIHALSQDTHKIKNHINLYYNLSLMYINFKEYEKAIITSSYGIELALNYNNFFMLAYLYYNRFLSHAILNNRKLALLDLQQCINLFNLQTRKKELHKVLNNDLKKYKLDSEIYYLF